MDLLAATENMIPEDEESAPTGPQKSEAQIQAENKFQKAIAVWKGMRGFNVTHHYWIHMLIPSQELTLETYFRNSTALLQILWHTRRTR